MMRRRSDIVRKGRGIVMKIGEAQSIYREQVQRYRKEKADVSKQLQNLRKRMEATPEGAERYR